MSDQLERARFDRLVDELRPRLLGDLAARHLAIYSIDGLSDDDVDRWRRAARKIARAAGLKIRTGFTVTGDVYVVEIVAQQLESVDGHAERMAAIVAKLAIPESPASRLRLAPPLPLADPERGARTDRR